MTAGEEAPASASRARTWAAGLVHAYTASGAVLALLMVQQAQAGHEATVLWLFLAAMVVDGTDGMLARRVRVKEAMPGFDGALLDNIVDYLTYVFAPVVLLWSTGRLPEGPLGGVLAGVPLLASCVQFCRVAAKTEDHFFWGFPSYWNVLAFYAVAADAGPLATSVAVLVCAVLVFVPVKYLYPSRTEAWWPLTFGLTAGWFAAYAGVVAALPHPPAWLLVLSLVYPAYYVALSLWLTVRPAPPAA